MKAMISQRGDFGPEANRNLASNLITNAARGDRAAQQLLEDLMLPRSGGPIGDVLTGGMTPQEIEKQNLERGAKNNAERQRAFAKQRADAARAEETSRKLGEDLTRQGERFEEQMLRDQAHEKAESDRAAKRQAEKARHDAEQSRKEQVQSQIDAQQEMLRQIHRSEQLNRMQVNSGQMTQEWANALKNQNDFKEWAIQDQIAKLQQSLRGSALPR